MYLYIFITSEELPICRRQIRDETTSPLVFYPITATRTSASP